MRPRDRSPGTLGTEAFASRFVTSHPLAARFGSSERGTRPKPAPWQPRRASGPHASAAKALPKGRAAQELGLDFEPGLI